MLRAMIRILLNWISLREFILKTMLEIWYCTSILILDCLILLSYINAKTWQDQPFELMPQTTSHYNIPVLNCYLWGQHRTSLFHSSIPSQNNCYLNLLWTVQLAPFEFWIWNYIFTTKNCLNRFINDEYWSNKHKNNQIDNQPFIIIF